MYNVIFVDNFSGHVNLAPMEWQEEISIYIYIYINMLAKKENVANGCNIGSSTNTLHYYVLVNVRHSDIGLMAKFFSIIHIYNNVYT